MRSSAGRGWAEDAGGQRVMTIELQACPGPSTCWTVEPVDPRDTGAAGRMRDRLLELLHLGYRRILLDLSACSAVPIGKLHVLGELVAWFDSRFYGSPVDIRALAPDENLQRLLKDAGIAPQVPVVAGLADVVQGGVEAAGDAPGEQALFLTYALSWPRGTTRELTALRSLAPRLARVVQSADGELDGYDVVGQHGVFFLYGPDATVLWRCAQAEALRDEPRLVGVELRFGGLSAPHVHLLTDATAACAWG